MTVIAENKQEDKLTVEIKEFCQNMDSEESEILLADGFEEAFIGVGNQYTKETVAIYDREKCIEILMNRFKEDNSSEDPNQAYFDAIEYLDFNVTGSWVGDRTPIFIQPFESGKV